MQRVRVTIAALGAMAVIGSACNASETIGETVVEKLALGQVRDPSGAPAAGAEVVLVRASNPDCSGQVSILATIQTNAAGQYRLWTGYFGTEHVECTGVRAQLAWPPYGMAMADSLLPNVRWRTGSPPRDTLRIDLQLDADL